MSKRTLELTIQRFLSIPQATYPFCWQGGEPTLMGVDFYRRVVDLQRRYCYPGSRMINTLQTNAILLNDRFSRFLSDSKFLVGVSLDGPADIHDHHRKNKIGKGSHADVIRGLECLKRNHAEFNILTLVTDVSVNRGKEVYRYLRDSGFLYHQYVPCVEFDPKGQPAPFTVSGEAWGRFLCDIYDEWRKNDIRTVSVRLFDSVIAYLVNGTHDNCQMGSNCCQYYVIEYNGDIYPCDFFVSTGLKLGNTRTDAWEDMASSIRYRDFGVKKSEHPAACKDCEVFAFCFGDCLKHRLYGQGEIDQLSWLCTGWKRFYQYALPGFVRLADRIRSGRLQTA